MSQGRLYVPKEVDRSLVRQINLPRDIKPPLGHIELWTECLRAIFQAQGFCPRPPSAGQNMIYTPLTVYRMHSHICCICLAFLHCVFSSVESKSLDQSMHIHIGYICLAFLHCVFSNVSSRHLHKTMQNHIGCICKTFPQCEFSNVSSNCLPEKRHSHTGCICLAFLHCLLSSVCSNRLPKKMHIYIGCICLI